MSRSGLRLAIYAHGCRIEACRAPQWLTQLRIFIGLARSLVARRLAGWALRQGLLVEEALQQGRLVEEAWLAVSIDNSSGGT